MVQDNLKYYGFVDDGNVRLEKGDCYCHHHNHCHGPHGEHHGPCHDSHEKPNKPAPFPPGFDEKPPKPEVDKHPHEHEVDNYVRGGYFDYKRGVIVFDLGEGKTSKIDMFPLCEHVLNGSFIRYSGRQYPLCNKDMSIILENNEGLFGKCFDGGGAYSLASINRRNEIEIGSRKLPIMIQGLGGRPIYNEKNEIAFVSDIPDITNYATIEWVKKKIADTIAGEVDLSEYLTKEEADKKYASEALTEEEIRSLLN